MRVVCIMFASANDCRVVMYQAAMGGVNARVDCYSNQLKRDESQPGIFRGAIYVGLRNQGNLHRCDGW